MSDLKFCPECGEKLEAGERFCQNCGAGIEREEVSKKQNQDTGSADGKAPIIAAGARANVTGGISSTTTENNNITTTHVDSSSTVNNTTIVMSGGAAEEKFCEVCGNPLDEKHARCPKCGRNICFDCKVKGKNRCVECEKKAVNEYRLAFQQLLLTTGGTIGRGSRQIMDQKARDLDVTEAKAEIEKELVEACKPEVKPVQPEVKQTVAPVTVPPVAEKGEESKGSKGQRVPLQPKSSGGNGKGIAIIAMMVLAVIAYFVFTEKDSASQGSAAAAVDSAAVLRLQEPQPAPAAKTEVKTVSEVPVAAAPEPEPVAKSEVEKPDVNYDAGMKAYESGEGLEAVKSFTASGSARSYYMLGVIYEGGCGKVAANAMMARKHFKTAADMGSVEAKAKL